MQQFQRLRPADVKALREVDAALAQEVQRRLVGNELGDRALAEPVGEADDRVDDELVGPSSPLR